MRNDNKVSLVMTAVLAIFIGAIIYLIAGVATASTNEPLPEVTRRCAFVQGGVKASLGDLNFRRQAGTPYAAVKKVCWEGAKGDTGPAGPPGADGVDGVDGTDGADANIGLPVCASNGGNLKLCGGDEGHDPVGYLVAATE